MGTTLCFSQSLSLSLTFFLSLYLERLDKKCSGSRSDSRGCLEVVNDAPCHLLPFSASQPGRSRRPAEILIPGQAVRSGVTWWLPSAHQDRCPHG